MGGPVTIRRATADDAELIFAWRNEPAAQRYQPLRPLSLAGVRQQLSDRAALELGPRVSGELQWIIAAAAGPVGWITVRVYNREHGVGELGYTVGSADHRRGFASAASLRGQYLRIHHRLHCHLVGRGTAADRARPRMERRLDRRLNSDQVAQTAVFWLTADRSRVESTRPIGRGQGSRCDRSTDGEGYMALGLAALQVVLASTLLAAAAGKLLRRDEFVSALRLSHLPERLVAVLAVLVPGLEVGFAAWLILASPAAVPLAFVATLVLLILFTTWMGWVRIRRLRVRCGCFGPNGGEVGAGTIGRNLGLIGLAGLGWLVSLTVSTALAGPSLWMVLLVVGFTLCIALVSALRFAWPHFTLTEDRLRVGGGAGE